MYKISDVGGEVVVTAERPHIQYPQKGVWCICRGQPATALIRKGIRLERQLVFHDANAARGVLPVLAPNPQLLERVQVICNSVQQGFTPLGNADADQALAA